MLKYICALLFVLAGPFVLHGQTAEEQRCVDQGVQITRVNDTAIMRARSTLEIPAVRVFMVSALHLIRVENQPVPPTLNPCMTLKDQHESGAGANITYVYSWDSGSSREFNQVTFHCDANGLIDRVDAGPSSNQPFTAFGNYLQQTQGKLTAFVINKLTEPDNPDGEGNFDKQARETVGDLFALLVTTAYPVEPRAFTVFALAKLYQAQFSVPPARGMDGFLFGLDETKEFRQIAIDRSELPRAVQRIADISVKKSGLRESGTFDVEAGQIAVAAEKCAQITAHDAFTVTVGGNQGSEALARLNPEFRVCDGLATSAQPGSGTVRARPLLFSVAPTGRGWRDGKGTLVQVWFQPRASDPAFLPDALFDRYGLFTAVLPQPDVPCARPAGGGTPPDRDWIQEGTTNIVYRFRFDCEHAEIYDAPSHLLLADLVLQRSAGDSKKDAYKGVGPISSCPGGTGKVEISRWSTTRIEVKVEEPNPVDHVCGGIKAAHIIDAVTHENTIKVTFLPTTK